ncbi:ARF GTPase-activating GIT2-like isoform X1, partial [Brachionus plicatilis]
QLFSCVKTSNYEQTLRILSQGADANYRCQETANQCIHEAILNNQIGQIEILCLYGAELTSVDRNGLTALDLARSLNLETIADRLVELQFELTDDISYFLCNKKPDHRSGQHFMIPDLSLEPKDARNLKLDELPDYLFDELSKDIYDELDRRQLETIWKCIVGPNLMNEAIPFLVIKSCFTQTRNQLRQKLARFNSYEFSGLLIEILYEYERRYLSLFESPRKEVNNSIEDVADEDFDDDLYDKVPSDEDYASVASESESTQTEVKNKSVTTPLKLDLNSVQAKNFICSPTLSASSASSASSPNSKLTKILNTKFEKAPQHIQSSLVANAESALNFIMNSLNKIDLNNSAGTPTHGKSPISPQINTELSEIRSENNLMKSMIERLMEENAQLRAENMHLQTNSNAESVKNQTTNFISQNINNYYSNDNLYSSVKTTTTTTNTLSEHSPLAKSRIKDSEHKSKYELYSNKIFFNQNQKLDKSKSPGGNIHSDNCGILKNLKLDSLFDGLQSNETLKMEDDPSQKSALNSNSASPYRSPAKSKRQDSLPLHSSHSTYNKQLENLKLLSPSRSASSNLASRSKNIFNDPANLPSKDAVIKKMKKITKAVQELFKATKDSEFTLIRQLCDKVNVCVNEMIVLFPSNLNSAEIRENLVVLEGTSSQMITLTQRYRTQLEAFASQSLPDQRLEEISLKNAIITDLVSFSYEIAHTI